MQQRSMSTSDLGSSVVEMAPSGSSGLLSGLNWDVENDLFTSDFVLRHPLPHVGLITKGQFLHLGAPNLANPSLKPYVLFYARKTVRKVLGEVVRVKDVKRGTPQVEQKIAIPVDYHGFFEILSEEGRPTRAIELVKDLFKLFPEMCLVRSPCKAYLPDDEGRLVRTITTKTRQLEPGEVLTLVGQFNYKKTAYLRCFDELGRSVYLKMSQKAKFSPVAHKEAISGVHYMRNLAETKRFPLTVRLIQGTLPPDLKLNSSPCPIIKLKALFDEDLILGYVLHKEGELISIPLNSFLKIAPCLAQTQLTSRAEFRAIVEYCDRHAAEHLNRLSAFNDQHIELKLLSSSNLASDVPAKTPSPIDDEEIDQLYDYIRGFAPMPAVSQRPLPPAPTVEKETLPSRKSDEPPPEKTRLRSRERRAYTKNNENHQPVVFESFTNSAEKQRYDRKYQLSKSTEKLIHSAQHLPRPDPTEYSHHRRPHDKRRHSKLRPVSMVIPDNVFPVPGMPAEAPNGRNLMKNQRFPSASNLYFSGPLPEERIILAPMPGGPPPPYTAYKPPLFHRYPALHRY